MPLDEKEDSLRCIVISYYCHKSVNGGLYELHIIIKFQIQQTAVSMSQQKSSMFIGAQLYDGQHIISLEWQLQEYNDIPLYHWKKHQGIMPRMTNKWIFSLNSHDALGNGNHSYTTNMFLLVAMSGQSGHLGKVLRMHLYYIIKIAFEQCST